MSSWPWSTVQQEISSINFANHCKKLWTVFFSFKKDLFIYLDFLAAMGLCCCTWTYSSCGEWAYTLRQWTTHVGSFSCCRAQAYGIQWLPCTRSVIAAQGLIGSAVCGIFQDQGWNWGPLHCKVDSLPLDQQGNPQNHFWHVWSVTAPLHTLHKSFFHLHFYRSLNHKE